MRTIHKFSLRIEDRQGVMLPAGAKLLTVQEQNGVLCLWAEVETLAPLEAVEFAVYGTGLPCDGGQYIGTAQVRGLVWHVYRLGDDPAKE